MDETDPVLLFRIPFVQHGVAEVHCPERYHILRLKVRILLAFPVLKSDSQRTMIMHYRRPTLIPMC